MQTFSNEIIIEVFRNLNQQDQAQGRLLGRIFNNAIRNIHHQTVYIYSARALDSLVRNVLEDPTIANRIQRLVINFPENEALFEDEVNVDENSQQARSRESRLQRINVNRNKNNVNGLLRETDHLIALHSSVSGFLTRNQATLPLRTHIELISEADNASIVHHLLSTGNCPRLSALRSNTFLNFPMLRMAPGLRILYLTRLDVQTMNIDFTGFELIHRQMPLLQSLRLSNLNFQGRLLFPQNFQVAPLVRHFSTSVLHGALNTLQYMAAKYPGLTSLEFDIGDTMVRNDQVTSLYLNGWVPLLTRLGAGLESLTSFAHVRDWRIIQAMDIAQCQINFLSLDRANPFSLLALSNSRQTEFIETLILKETACQQFGWLPHFTNLRKLKLVNCRESIIVAEIQLAQVLTLAPATFRSLSLESLAFVLDHEAAENRNVTSLSFDNVIIGRQVADDIPRCFPSLDRLKLKFSLVEEDYIELIHFNLKEFHFHGAMVFAGDSRHLMVHTNINNELRHYSVSNYDRKAINKDVVSLIDPNYLIPFRSEVMVIDQIEAEDIDVELLLICNSLKKIIFV